MAVISEIGSSVELQTFTSFEDAEAIAAEWDELVERLDGSLYVTYGWCRVWWRHYGDRRELRVIAIRDGAELVGVLPFFTERLGPAFGRARVAKLVGSDFTIAMVDPPLQPAIAAEAFTRAARELFDHDRVDMLHVGPVSGTAPQLAGIRESAAELAGTAELARDREAGAHTAFELPEGFDAYVQGLSKNQRSNYKRNVNKLKKAFDFRVDVVRGGEMLEPEFEAFVDMHQAQWQAVNKLGHYGDWPDSRAFTRDLVQALAAADRVRLIRLVADEQVVSYYFCFEFNGTYYWRLSSRLNGEEWGQFALGRVGLLKMLEVAAAEGATSIEAGNGRYGYKEQLNAATLPLHSLTLRRSRLASRCRARAALAMGDLLNLAYYRVWFLKLAPRVGIGRRPLWRSWIRSRF
jgi:CelD/BcsL family acetyltransferase involved in cellulose biosynthesis